MNRDRCFRCAAATHALAGMFVNQLALAASPPMPRPTATASRAAVRDIALRDGGLLLGQVVDAAGSPQVNTKVAIARQSGIVATLTTNGDGRFEVPGLNGGVYQIITAHSSGAYRIWSARTAPPTAEQEVLLVAGEDVVRGQGPPGAPGGALRWLGNPWVLGGIVATAIIVPLALDKKSGS